MNELRVALRQHVRQRSFALTVAITLALVIGATTAVFSVVHTVLARALPFTSPDRLVWVASVRTDNPNAPFSLPEYMDYRSRTRTLSGLAAYANWSASVAGDGTTERLTGARMSANAFDVLGVRPAAGRLLSESDDRADAPRVVLLSYRVWQQRYGGTAETIGRSIRINAESFVVAGVLPAHFPLPLRDLDVVAPLVPDRDPLRHARNSVNFLRFFGRLHASTDARQAEAELTTICRSLRQQFPVEYARKDAVRAVPLHQMLVADFRQSMLLLLAAVMVVLTTALANIVSLALVRANARRSELAMRIAMGASRVHLTRQLTVESLLLAAAGTGLGWVIAGSAIRAAVRWAPAAIPRLDEAGLDATAALFAAAVAILVTAVLTIAPLGATARTGAGDALRGVSRGAIGDGWNHRVRNVMIVAEISAALLLLLATGVLVQNLLGLHRLHPGFNPDGVFQARVSIPPAYRSTDDVSRFYDRLSERVAASPEVKQTGVISVAPLSGLLATVPFSVEGQAATERGRASANIRAISAGYLSTVGTRLLYGRVFTEGDASNTPPVALVSAALADRFLPGRRTGRRLLIDDNNTGPRPIEIIGVVENVRHTALELPPAFDIYIPLRQVHSDGVPFVRNNQFWMVAVASDPAAFRATFLAHLRAVDADAAISGTSTMREFVDASLGPRRFNLGLFAAFALTAVLLAVVGCYGLVSYAVNQRAAEIALRMAVGATQRDVQWMIVRQAAGLAIAGAAAGLSLAGAVRPFIPDAMENASIDPAMAAGAVALLMGVVLMAAWLPSRRAACIEPTLALKAL